MFIRTHFLFNIYAVSSVFSKHLRGSFLLMLKSDKHLEELYKCTEHFDESSDGSEAAVNIQPERPATQESAYNNKSNNNKNMCSGQEMQGTSLAPSAAPSGRDVRNGNLPVPSLSGHASPNSQNSRTFNADDQPIHSNATTFNNDYNEETLLKQPFQVERLGQGSQGPEEHEKLPGGSVRYVGLSEENLILP